MLVRGTELKRHRGEVRSEVHGIGNQADGAVVRFAVTDVHVGDDDEDESADGGDARLDPRAEHREVAEVQQRDEHAVEEEDDVVGAPLDESAREDREDGHRGQGGDEGADEVAEVPAWHDQHHGLAQPLLAAAASDIGHDVHQVEHLNGQRHEEHDHPGELRPEQRPAVDADEAEDEQREDDLEQGDVARGGHRLLAEQLAVQVVVAEVALEPAVTETQRHLVDVRLVEELAVGDVLLDALHDQLVVLVALLTLLLPRRVYRNLALHVTCANKQTHVIRINI